SARSSVKPSCSRAVSSSARAASTCACAASRAFVARSKAARGATSRAKSDCWRSNSSRASAARAWTAARLARADCTAFWKVVASSRATSWPGATRSPTRTLRSTMRCPTRKARLTSSSASMRPVRVTVSPAGTISTVSVRTGRISGAPGSSTPPQAAKSARAAQAGGIAGNRRQLCIGTARRLGDGLERLHADQVVAPDPPGAVLLVEKHHGVARVVDEVRAGRGGHPHLHPRHGELVVVTDVLEGGQRRGQVLVLELLDEPALGGRVLRRPRVQGRHRGGDVLGVEGRDLPL